MNKITVTNHGPDLLKIVDLHHTDRAITRYPSGGFVLKEGESKVFSVNQLKALIVELPETPQ